MRIDAEITKTYSYGKNVFCGLQFHLEDGEIMSLLGGDGAGKTTLLKCVAGVTDFEGEILFDGKKLPIRQDDVIMLSDDGNVSGRAVARYCHGNGIACAFKLCAHHRDSKQRSSESCGAYSA